MTTVSYQCNNPDTVILTNNDNYNIFIDTKMNIVYLKGIDKYGKTKQIKLGNCNDQINNICENKPIECCNPNPNISCDEIFKYIGFFISYDQLIEQTKNKKINNLSIALVNGCDKQIKLYIYYTSNKKWNVVGTVLDLSNMSCSTPSNTPICSYQTSSSVETECKEHRAKYILFKPEFIEQCKLKQNYVDQLNKHLPNTKYYIKFNDLKCFPSSDKFIVDGKYIVNYNISFCYNIDDEQSNSSITYETVTSKSTSNSILISEQPDDELLNINKKGTLIIICKIIHDDIEILSSSIKNVINSDINYPMATNHGFICDFKYSNNIILLIYPLSEVNDNVKLNILQNSTYVQMDQI